MRLCRETIKTFFSTSSSADCRFMLSEANVVVNFCILSLGAPKNRKIGQFNSVETYIFLLYHNLKAIQANF
jgi:hypothetical protein